MTSWSRAILVSWALAICASLPCASSGTAIGSPAQAVTVLHFVSWKPDHPEVWEEAIRAFTTGHPHIRIVREIAPHSSTAYHDLLTQKLKNRDPSVDVFFMDVIWVPEFAAAGWVRPLDDLFSPAARADFLPATVQVGVYQENPYGVPSRIDAGLLYYRADLLRKYGFEPPRTWEELVRQAEAIVDGERATTATLRGYTAQFKQYEGLVCNMLEFIGSHGGRLVDEETATAHLSDPRTLGALEFVRMRILSPLTSRAILTYQEQESLASFVQGNAVFHRNWPYAWEIANNPSRSRVAGLVGLAPLPGGPDRPGTAALGGWLFGISARSRHPAEAWAFISFLTSEEMQGFFARRAGIAPSRTVLYSDPEVLAANPQWRNHLDVLRSATPRPRSPLYPALSHILQRFFSRALAYPDLDLEAEARRADSQLTRLLRLTRSGAP